MTPTKSDNALKALEKSLTAGEVGRTATVAKRLARTRRPQVVARLLQILRNCDDVGIKNAAAVALRDLKEPRAVPILMDLVQRSEYRHRRGTFVYAVAPLPWERRFAARMTSLACCEENFEVREMAVKAFEARVGHLSSAQRLAISDYLTRQLFKSRLSLEASEAAAHVLKLLADAQLGERSQRRSA